LQLSSSVYMIRKKCEFWQIFVGFKHKRLKMGFELK
jgi:hypothetical protein